MTGQWIFLFVVVCVGEPLVEYVRARRARRRLRNRKLSQSWNWR